MDICILQAKCTTFNISSQAVIASWSAVDADERKNNMLLSSVLRD